MPYLRNEPVATDDLDISQPKLANNTNASDNSFGVDHYPFSDLTADNGHHNQVTTPLIVGSAHPTTDSTHTILYCMQDSANIGLLQYSRGPSNAVPSPVTFLQSPNSPIIMNQATTTTILDFTGISKASFILYWQNLDNVTPINRMAIGWFVNGTPSIFNITPITSNNSVLAVQTTGNVLELLTGVATTANNVYWTLVFNRIWT